MVVQAKQNAGVSETTKLTSLVDGFWLIYIIKNTHFYKTLTEKSLLKFIIPTKRTACITISFLRDHVMPSSTKNEIFVTSMDLDSFYFIAKAGII